MRSHTHVNQEQVQTISIINNEQESHSSMPIKSKFQQAQTRAREKGIQTEQITSQYQQ